MCQSCEPLLKAIDAYIEKANDDLSGRLKDAGFEKAKDTVKEINAIEDEVAEALTDETSYFVDSLSDSDSLEDFASDVWQKVKQNDKLGVISIGMGFGDYYNVFNALTQMPKGSTYLYGLNSWWYVE
ncbi:MAG: hypothetical protein LIO41_01495 [Ruminococcus sp.]|nr:hypothetical protein [Ruminococcus sp.]